MKVSKKELDNALKIVKRVLAKNKKDGKMILFSDGNGEIIIEARNNYMRFLTSIPSLDDETFSYVVNPHEFGKVIKGKEREMEFVIEKGKIKEKGQMDSYNIESFQGNHIQIPKEDVFKPFTHPTEFIKLLKEADDVLTETDQECSQYLKFSSKQAIAVEPKRINLYRLDENFEFREATIHKEVVSTLAKSVSKNITHAILAEELVIKDDKNFYFIDLQAKVIFPNLRKIKTRERSGKYKFIVNADELNKLLKVYTKKCPTLAVEFKKDLKPLFDSEVQGNGYLIFTPSTEDFPVQQMPIRLISETLPMTKFDTSTLKGLFIGYKGNVEVEHLEFKNIIGEIGYMWRITTPEKMIMIGGISIHDYDEQERKLQEMRLKKNNN